MKFKLSALACVLAVFGFLAPPSASAQMGSFMSKLKSVRSIKLGGDKTGIVDDNELNSNTAAETVTEFALNLPYDKAFDRVADLMKTLGYTIQASRDAGTITTEVQIKGIKRDKYWTEVSFFRGNPQTTTIRIECKSQKGKIWTGTGNPYKDAQVDPKASAALAAKVKTLLTDQSANR